jgi:hypothetical protein
VFFFGTENLEEAANLEQPYTQGKSIVFDPKTGR